jgi:hypothetical protein
VTTTAALRSAVAGLAGHAAVEEEMLLASAPDGELGDPGRWAAVPLIAHHTEFKKQQVQRLAAVAGGTVPPVFSTVDHGSAAVYQGYASAYRDEPGRPAAAAARASRQATAALLDTLAGLADEDLLNPARHPWLDGRPLWLQVIVRAFWHPMGHLGEYYLAHGQTDRAAAMQAHAVAAARYLAAPAPARGMALYNLACARARSDQPESALGPLRQALRLNRELAASAARDTDLAVLRDRGQLDPLLAR